MSSHLLRFSHLLTLFLFTHPLSIYFFNVLVTSPSLLLAPSIIIITHFYISFHESLYFYSIFFFFSCLSTFHMPWYFVSSRHYLSPIIVRYALQLRLLTLRSIRLLSFSLIPFVSHPTSVLPNAFASASFFATINFCHPNSHLKRLPFFSLLRMLWDADVESGAKQDGSEPRRQCGAGLQGVQQARHVFLAEGWQGKRIYLLFSLVETVATLLSFLYLLFFCVSFILPFVSFSFFRHL